MARKNTLKPSARPRGPLHPEEDEVDSDASVKEDLTPEQYESLKLEADEEGIDIRSLIALYAAKRGITSSQLRAQARAQKLALERPPPIKKSRGQYNIYILPVAVAVLLAVIFGFVNPRGEIDTASQSQWMQQNYARHISVISKQFPSQVKSIWPDFYTGIRKVLFDVPTEPSLFLLVHHGDHVTSSCLARHVGHLARRMMNVTHAELLILDGASLGKSEAFASDRGRFVADYKPVVEERNVMIVNDLEKMPADLARILHGFCDTVTPLVHKAVYIFTLNVGEGHDGVDNPTKLAERALNSAWEQLDIDIRQPLITRITAGVVLKVYPESNLMDC